jgi:hypothetical protein
MMIAATINAGLAVVDGTALGNVEVIICVPSNTMVLFVVYADVDVWMAWPYAWMLNCMWPPKNMLERNSNVYSPLWGTIQS